MNASIHSVSCDWLLVRAKNPEDGLTRAFAGVIQAASKGEIRPPNLGMGLTQDKFIELLECYFPGSSLEICGDNYQEGSGNCVSLLVSEFDDLVELLLDHRTSDAEYNEWLAHAVASGCMGGNHLYQDMGLPDRHALSALLERHFTTLYLKNVNDMKWKKFFYKQLCDRAEVIMCPARSCQACIDYHNCFELNE
jgi:nitrogen fixation protein NifQ